MDAVSIVSCCKTRRFLTQNFLRFALVFSCAVLVASQAAAQYGGGGGTMGGGTPGYTPPKGGYSSAKGAGIGAGAAAGAGALFLALHHRGYVTGCVQPTEDGLRLVDEKKNQSYALVSGDVYLKPGQRVQLKGQRSKNESGERTFEPKKLVKDLGACSTSSAASSSHESDR
jgi:hypothetical protein